MLLCLPAALLVSRWGSNTGSSADPGQSVLRVGLSRVRSSPCAHRALIASRPAFRTGFSVASSSLPVKTSPVRCPSPPVMLCPGDRLRKIRSQRLNGERSRHAQCTRERPAPLRQFEAFRAGMQVCPPARKSRLRVGEDAISHGHQAKQAGLHRTLPAADARAHGEVHRVQLLRSRGHSTYKSTVKNLMPPQRKPLSRQCPAGCRSASQ
jgi:hypothetical protein